MKMKKEEEREKKTKKKQKEKEKEKGNQATRAGPQKYSSMMQYMICCSWLIDRYVFCPG